jgi:hypothetical protein
LAPQKVNNICIDVLNCKIDQAAEVDLLHGVLLHLAEVDLLLVVLLLLVTLLVVDLEVPELVGIL